MNTMIGYGTYGNAEHPDYYTDGEADTAARLDAAETLMAYADSLDTWEAEWCGPDTAARIRDARADAGGLLASVGVYPPVITRGAW